MEHNNADHEVGIVSDILTRLDSNGGDFSDLTEQIENVDALADIHEKVVSADEHTEKAFSLLDETILQTCKYDGEGSGVWVDGRPDDALQSLDSHLSDAEDDLRDAAEMADDLSDDETPDGFSFGAHDTVHSALWYLHTDIEYTAQMASDVA